MTTAALRETLRRAFEEGLRSIDLRRLVAEALPGEPAEEGAIVVLSVGKAAPRMAAGALDRWGARISKVLVVTTDGTDASFLPDRATLLRAGHPLPDARSLLAAEAALASLPRGPDDLLLALISGGGSSLLHAPPRSLDLGEIRAIVSALVRSRLPIQRINTVRRHLSRVHGGRLARSAYPARALTLYASDVPQGEAYDVASGPTVPDPTTIEDASQALREVFGDDRAAEIARHLDASLAPSDPEAARTESIALATPTTLAEAVAARLRSRGFHVRVAPERASEMPALLSDYAAMAASLAPKSALVFPCEPSLSITGPAGRGGRAGYLALALLPRLPPDVAFLAGASDGVDGASGHGGACVGGDIPHDPRAIAEALAAFDDAPMNDALGTSLADGPTGINLTDIHIVARR